MCSQYARATWKPPPDNAGQMEAFTLLLGVNGSVRFPAFHSAHTEERSRSLPCEWPWMESRVTTRSPARKLNFNRWTHHFSDNKQWLMRSCLMFSFKMNGSTESLLVEIFEPADTHIGNEIQTKSNWTIPKFWIFSLHLWEKKSFLWYYINVLIGQILKILTLRLKIFMVYCVVSLSLRPRASSSSSQSERSASPLVMNSTQSLDIMPRFAIAPEEEGEKGKRRWWYFLFSLHSPPMKPQCWHSVPPDSRRYGLQPAAHQTPEQQHRHQAILPKRRIPTHCPPTRDSGETQIPLWQSPQVCLRLWPVSHHHTR